jgi:hypothetical protein
MSCLRGFGLDVGIYYRSELISDISSPDEYFPVARMNLSLRIIEYSSIVFYSNSSAG